MRNADDGLRKIIMENLAGQDWKWTPIETGGTTNGVPDAYFMHRPSKQKGWVESKKTDGWAVKVEPHQVMWHKLHAEICNSYFAVRTRGLGSSGGKGDGLWLVRGTAAALLQEGGLQAVRASGDVLGSWTGAPRNWPWWEIERVLLGKIV
jgi:hypothetical protein